VSHLLYVLLNFLISTRCETQTYSQIPNKVMILSPRCIGFDCYFDLLSQVNNICFKTFALRAPILSDSCHTLQAFLLLNSLRIFKHFCSSKVNSFSMYFCFSIVVMYSEQPLCSNITFCSLTITSFASIFCTSVVVMPSEFVL